MDKIKMSSMYGEFGKKNKIELRTLKLKSKPTVIQQIDKIREEDDEFVRAILKEDHLNAIEEFHDKITASLNALKMIGVSIEDVVNGQNKHFNKLLKRGWEFNE